MCRELSNITWNYSWLSNIYSRSYSLWYLGYILPVFILDQVVFNLVITAYCVKALILPVMSLDQVIFILVITVYSI